MATETNSGSPPSRSRIPLHRRFRAWRGRIFGFLFWLGSAVLSLVLYQYGGIDSQTFAIASVASSAVSAPEGGRVTAILVKPGQLVKAGDTLIELEIPGLTQEIAAANAEIAALKEESQVDTQDRVRRSARDLDSAEARLMAAQVSLQDARSEVAEIRLEYTRISAPGVALPAREVEAVRAKLDAAEEAVQAREESLAGLQRLAKKARGRAEGLDPQLQARLEVLQLEVDALVARQAAAILKAPRDGVVVAPTVLISGEVQPSSLPVLGMWINGGDTVASVVEPATREAIAWMDVGQTRGLKAGSTLTLTDAGGVVLGTVQSVGPAAMQVPSAVVIDPTRPEWRIPVTVHVAERDLVPGEIMVASF